jgi:hypothetical protein
VDRGRLVRNQHQRSLDRRLRHYTIHPSENRARQRARGFDLRGVWGSDCTFSHILPGCCRGRHHGLGPRVLATRDTAILDKCVGRADGCPHHRASELRGHLLDSEGYSRPILGSGAAGGWDRSGQCVDIRLPACIAGEHSGIAVCSPSALVMGCSAISVWVE